MLDNESSSSSQRADNETAPLTPSYESTREQEEAAKPFLVPGLKMFLLDSIRSKAVLPAFVISILLSASIGLTVGIVPEVLTDRYARLYYGYDDDQHHYYESAAAASGEDDSGGGLQPLPPCWGYDTSSMPEACVEGADDAQTGSAYGMLAQNLLTLFFNAVIGSYSDKKGRRFLLNVSIFLNTLVPAALVAMELIEGMNPVWYYAANAVTGIISYPTLIFAMLSDGCPQQHLAGRFATNMAGFYGGFAIAPTLAMYASHIVVSWWSLALSALTLAFSIIFLPETLPESVVVVATTVVSNAASEDAMALVAADSLQQDQQQQQQSQSMMTSSAEEEHEGHSSIERATNRAAAAAAVSVSRTSSCMQTTGTLLLRPLREMTILTRNRVLRLLAMSSFLSAAVYNTDASLVLFYIEEHLNVREDDIAVMFMWMGMFGVILQGIGLQPLVYLLGEKGLLVVSFISGTIHNWLYGVATNKTEITAALNLSQLTKLSYPLLSSLASQQVGIDEQGRVQGALLALNALAGAVGPVSMNWIYEKTKDSSPGMMFLLSSGLYLLGTVVVSLIPASSASTAADGSNSNNSDTNYNCNRSSANETDETTGRSGSCESPLWEGRDLEEPLLLQLGETITI
jgi:Na+/melibiose symporter-like transporter